MTDTVDKVIIESEVKGASATAADLNKVSGALDGVSVASQNVEKSTASIESRFQGLERRFQTSAGQAAQYEKIQSQVNLAVKQNPDLQDRANSVLAAAEARYLGTGKAVTELADAHKGLDAQGQAALHSVRSMVEQLALGIPPTQALTGQLNHLTFAASGEGGLAGAFKQVGGLVGGLITPMTATIALTAAAAAGALALANAYDKVQVSSQRALIGAGARTGTSVSDINKFTEQNSTSGFGSTGTSLSNKEARTLGEDLTKTGDIVVSQLHGMSDAVVGFANQTGKSIADASKDFVAFGKDPKKALEDLSAVFGPFSAGVREAVEEFVRADDKTGAYNIVLDALSEKAKAAAENMTAVGQAGRFIGNVLASETSKPVGLEGQLDAQRQRVVNAINTPTGGRSEDEAAKAAAIESEAKAFDTLNAAMQKVDAERAKAQTDKLATDAENADKAIISEINAIDQLKDKIAELNRAKEAGVTSKQGGDVDAAALQAAQNQLQALQQSQAEAARYNIEVANIASSWGNVGQSVALQLQTMENALPVAQAWTESGKIKAQYEATYLDLLNKGKTAQEATAVASKQEEVSRASAVASAQKMVQASDDNLEKIKAQGTEMEGVVASSIAYRDAIQAGATATQAAAIAANTLAANLAQAEANASRLQQDYTNAAMAAAAASGLGAFGGAGNTFGDFSVKSGQQYTTSGGDPVLNTSLFQQRDQQAAGVQGAANTAYSQGGIAAALAAVTNYANTSGVSSGQEQGFGQYGYDLQAILGKETSTVPAKIATYDQLVQLQNQQNPASATANRQAEIAWLQTLPQSQERDAKIADLTNALNGLTTSTNSLNSTMGDLLSPYYTQDPRTSHIGFRSQGMASGGEFTVPGGYSANDNMLAQIPVASGEIVSVRRPGQSSGGSGQVVNITNHITVGAGANKDEVGRTVYQSTQNAVRQFQAAQR